MSLRVARALAATLVLALAPASATACRQPPTPVVTAPVTTLDAHHEPLRARFDADADTPRLLVLASPA
jgi:hypothetical protein